MGTYYDIHCHVFNKDVVVRRLVNVVQSLVALKDMISGEISETELKLKIDGINKTLNDVLESTEEVYLNLSSAYNNEFVTTPLMFDLTFADDNDNEEEQNKQYRRRIKRIFGIASKLIWVAKLKIKEKELKKSLDPFKEALVEFHKKFEKKSDKDVEIFDDSNYAKQIIDLEYLAGKYKSIRPFFSVDPRRAYRVGPIMALLEEKLLGNAPLFAGVKLYAPAGFSPTDPVLFNDDGVYAFCSKNNIPLTVHNSNAGFACLSKNLRINGHIYINDKIDFKENYTHTFEHDFFSTKAGEAIHERAKLLNHPKLWKLVLEKFPTLTINFAHFGGSGQIMEYVAYLLPEKIDVQEFEKRVKTLNGENQKKIRSIYQKKRKFMYLKKDMLMEERAKIWNIMYSCGLIDNWAKGIFDLIKRPEHPNAYTDLSCFSEGALINLPGDEFDYPVFTIKPELKKLVRDFFNKLGDYEKSKILYGSDYYLTQFFGPSLKQYISDFKEAFGKDFEIIAQENPKRFLHITE